MWYTFASKQKRATTLHCWDSKLNFTTSSVIFLAKHVLCYKLLLQKLKNRLKIIVKTTLAGQISSQDVIFAIKILSGEKIKNGFISKISAGNSNFALTH